MKKKLISLFLAFTLVLGFGLTACDNASNPDYTLTLNAGTGGTVSGGGSYKAGASVTAVATANSGYVFEGWYEGTTKLTDAAASYTFSMPAKSYTLKAEFTQAGTQKQNQAALVITEVTGKCIGDEPFLLATTGGSGAGAVTFTQVSGEDVAVVTAQGNVTVYNPGDFVVTATKAADSTYNAVTSEERTITISSAPKQNQTTLVVDEVEGKIYGNHDFSLSVTGGSGTGSITYAQVSGTDVATVSTNGTVKILKAGSFVVTATKAADETYEAATSAERTVTIAKAEQGELTVNSPVEKYADDPSFDLTTSGGSGTGAVTYAQVGGTDVATVSLSGKVEIIKSGSFWVKAAKAADGNYNSTESEEITITILPALDPGKQTQATLTVNAVEGKTFGDSVFPLSTSGGSGDGAVTFALRTGGDVASVTEGGMVTIKKAGSFTVAATKAADDDYNVAVSEAITISISKAEQATLTVEPVVGKKYGDNPFDLSTSGGSGTGAIAFTLVNGGEVASVTDIGQVTIKKAGSFTVKATKAADVNYKQVSSDEITITIARANQRTLSIIPVTGKNESSADFQLNVSGGDGNGAIIFAQTSGTDVATVASNGTVTVLKEGEFKVTATKAADDRYNSATSAQLTVTIEAINDSEEKAMDISDKFDTDIAAETILDGTLWYKFTMDANSNVVVSYSGLGSNENAVINIMMWDKDGVIANVENCKQDSEFKSMLTQGEEYYIAIYGHVAKTVTLKVAKFQTNFNTSRDKAAAITVGQAIAVKSSIKAYDNIGSEMLYYSFTVAQSGNYIFSVNNLPYIEDAEGSIESCSISVSHGTDMPYTVVDLREVGGSTGYPSVSLDDTFSVEATLTAGVTYYIFMMISVGEAAADFDFTVSAK